MFVQNHTMQMMYEVIYKALQDMGLENEFEPQDYLNFFCLGTRESSQGKLPPSNGKISIAPNTPQVHPFFLDTGCGKMSGLLDRLNG